MSTATATPPSANTQPAPDIPNGTKAPAPGDVRKSLVDALHQAEQTIAGLQARVIALEATQRPAVEKRPVSDADLGKAIATLRAKNAASLEGASPKLDLSLSGQLGFVPILTDTQRKAWIPARDEMRHAHSQAWKAKSAEVMGYLRRAARNPRALMSGGIVTRKSDNAVNAVSLRASKLAKPIKTKGKGKLAAKPAPVAGKVPIPGNAAKPATVS
jgi:hypothetical protein